MTNKKFKLAAMSLALTACVAASPLAANAESADAEVNKPASTAATSTDETKQDTTNENNQKAADNNEQNAANNNEQDAANNNEQDAANNNEQNAANNNEQDAANNNEQDAANNNEQEAADENKQEAADKDGQETADENKQETADENKQEAADENEQEAADKNEQEAADENEQEAADKDEQEAADKNEQEAADKNEQETADKNEQETADENKQEAADKTEQETADKTEQETTEKTEQEAAVENKAPAAAAPVAKAPVLMTASLAAAPAAPAAPAEENTAAEVVATIDGKSYTSFDDAVSDAADGATIEVIKDATSTGIHLQGKKLTIKGTAQTFTTTTDSGTEENKPKLKFIAKEGQSQIVGITLWGSNLTFQNMDVDMTGASSTTYNKWNAVCMSHDAALTLDNTKFSMDGTGLATEAHGIYMAGRGRNELNVNNHSTLTINNCFNAIAWDGVGGGNEGSTYFINITDGSTFTADGNNGGIIGREALDVLVDNSTLTVTNCANRGDWEGRSGFNGADVKIVNGSTANISGNHGGYGIHANNLLVENSTLTANDNGYGGIRITGKGEFTNSTVTVTGTEEKGNASVEITWGVNDTETGLLNGSLSVRNSTLNISDNNATGIACLTYGGFHRSLTIDDASRVTIQNNNATPRNGFNAKGAVGGGLRIEAGCSAVLGRSTVINNNSADKAGADIFTEKGGTLTFSAGNAGIGDILQDCGDGIDGWYIDAEGQRWDFHGDPSVAQDLLDSKDAALEYNGDGTYTITAGSEGLALKAAHAELPAPTPDPDGPDTPTPNPNPKPEPKPGPDTSITPEDPQLPPVQDARADTPDSTVLPANPANPAVQDAHALPQTGTSLFAALAMALSGFALTIAGAWASLLGKNSRH